MEEEISNYIVFMKRIDLDYVKLINTVGLYSLPTMTTIKDIIKEMNQDDNIEDFNEDEVVFNIYTSEEYFEIFNFENQKEQE